MEIEGGEINLSKVEDTGFVARDKDGKLWFFFKYEPKREEKSWFWGRKGDKWILTGGWKIPIAEKYFPEVTWESEPLRVSIMVNI